MATTDEIPKTYDQAIETLAHWHGEGGEEDLEIYSFPDPAGQVVQLLEISSAFAQKGQVVPWRMGRSEEFPFPSEVALITHHEWSEIHQGRLGLPEGWDWASKQKVWPK